ncbi:hypothetical protein LCGC14_1976280, partial [marine sediment metagenome]
TAAERFAGRGIGEVVRGRIIERERAERRAAGQRQIETQRQLEEQQRIQREREKSPGTFQVTTIDRGGPRTPQTISVVETFATKAEAEAFLKKERFNFASDRDTPVGIRETPSIAKSEAKPRFRGREVSGPPPSERGRELQTRRLELEKITKKVEVTDGKVDLSKLTSGERARIRQLTGVTAAKAFTVQPGKPTTAEEFQKSLTAAERALETAEKIEARKPPTRAEPSNSSKSIYPWANNRNRVSEEFNC